MADLYYFQETRRFVWKIENLDELQLPFYYFNIFAGTLHTFSTSWCLQRDFFNFV